MESFYGGRSGAPFIIVQHFDGIDIPQPKDINDGTAVFTRSLYAIEEEYLSFYDEQQQVHVRELAFDYKIENDNLIIYDTQTGEIVPDKVPNFKITEDAAVGNVPIGDGKYLIKRTDANADKFLFWGPHLDDGGQVNDTTYTFPKTLARGMVQCFQQGARSSSEVNYGEYVIIDTICNLNQYNNPDNGKVYRRGMNIDSDLAGAEYIGQIVGPQGDSPELKIDKYSKITSLKHYVTTKYTLGEGDLVPGSYLHGSARLFNDDIKCAWVTLTDGYGNIEGCLLGFQFPTLVQDFEASSISPYSHRTQGTYGTDSQYTNLITEDESEFIDGQWKHPFFQKWNISIPQGYHGANSENIEIIHSWTMTPEYKTNGVDANQPGVINIYNDRECTSIYTKITSTSPIKSFPLLGTSFTYIDNTYSDREDYEKIYGKYLIEDGAEYDTSPDVISAKILLDGGVKYVKKEDCYRDIVRYKEVDFDKVKAGETRYYYIGDHNTIEKIALSDTGVLTAFYNAKPQPEELEEVIRWIDTTNSEGITIDDDGTIHVYYNTTHEPLGVDVDPHERVDEFGRAHDHQDFEHVLEWIVSASLDQNGKFTIIYNNSNIIVDYDEFGNPIYTDVYTTDLQWIDKVEFLENGTVIFRWNTDDGEGEPAYQFDRVIKYIADMSIDNGEIEGTGDQKIHVVYNTDLSGEESHPIGNPLNYVIEYAVATARNGFPKYTHSANSKNNKGLYSHLLVYYADPALRETLGAVEKDDSGAIVSSNWVTYPSAKYEGTVWTEWIDLGNVKGESGGVHILKEVTDISELTAPDGSHIPPEDLVDDNSQLILGDVAAGWSCSLGIAEYVAVLPDDRKAQQIVADSAVEDANHVRISTVNAISPGFSIGDYVKLEKRSDILFYDYDKKVWYPKSVNIDTGGGIANPKNVIDKSFPIYNAAQGGYIPDEAQGDAKDLEENGFWFASELGYFAE